MDAASVAATTVMSGLALNDANTTAFSAALTAASTSAVLLAMVASSVAACREREGGAWFLNTRKKGSFLCCAPGWQFPLHLAILRANSQPLVRRAATSHRRSKTHFMQSKTARRALRVAEFRAPRALLTRAPLWKPNPHHFQTHRLRRRSRRHQGNQHARCEGEGTGKGCVVGRRAGPTSSHGRLPLWRAKPQPPRSRRLSLTLPSPLFVPDSFMAG